MDQRSKVVFLQEVLNRKTALFSKDSRTKDESWAEIYDECVAKGCQGLRDADYLRRTTYQNLQRRAKEKYEKGLKVGLNNVNLTEVDNLLLDIIGRDRGAWSTTSAEDALASTMSSIPHELQSLFSLIGTTALDDSTTTKFDCSMTTGDGELRDGAADSPPTAESTSAASGEWETQIDESAAATPSSARAQSPPPPPPPPTTTMRRPTASMSPRSPAAIVTPTSDDLTTGGGVPTSVDKFGTSVLAALIKTHHQRSTPPPVSIAAATTTSNNANGGGVGRSNARKRSRPLVDSSSSIQQPPAVDMLDVQLDDRTLQRRKTRAEIALLEAQTMTQKYETRLKQLQIAALERELGIASHIN